MDRLSLMQDMADDLDDFEDDIEPFTFKPVPDLTAEDRRDRIAAAIAFRDHNPRGAAAFIEIVEIEDAFEVTFE